MSASSFQGKFLKLIEETLSLPPQTIVYCIVDLGYEFRVVTDRDFHGVREFVFEDSSREKFTEYL
tara:strand:- start:17 stop:211 length:195 start_codon:yes stop_codon:yes gene_type:complete